MKLKNKTGFTLIELMAVIAVMAIISAFFVVNTRPNYTGRLRTVAEQFAGDMRLVRNMAISRQVFLFNGSSQAVYPEGGYGVVVDSPANNYKMYAYKDAARTIAQEIKSVTLPNDIDIKDANSPYYGFFIAVHSEKEVNTTLVLNTANSNFSVDIGNFSCTGSCPRAKILVADKAADEIILSNIGVVYRVDVISIPTPASCFVAGTKILMADGTEKNIEDIRVGDFIMSAQNDLHAVTVREIEAPVREGYYQLTLENGRTLKLTNEHPIYARNNQGEDWAAFSPDTTYADSQLVVSNLSEMTEVLTVDGWRVIQNVNYVAGNIQTYNLSQVDGNTFYADGVKVHNKKPPTDGGGGVFP